MLNSLYELVDDELQSLSCFLRKLNREIIPSAIVIFGNRPRYDFSEYANSYSLTIDIPGTMSPEIYLDKNTLIINGEKLESNVDNQLNRIHMERKFGKFTRKIELPENCDKTRIKARLDLGVLEIQIPKVDLRVSGVFEIEVPPPKTTKETNNRYTDSSSAAAADIKRVEINE